jgi:integrase
MRDICGYRTRKRLLHIASGKAGGRYVGLRHAWTRIAKRAGLKGMTLRALRHSYATMADPLGCSEATVASLIGRSRGGSMTQRYIHTLDDALLAAADRVAGAIARAMAGDAAEVVQLCGQFLIAKGAECAWQSCDCGATIP